MLDKNEFRKFLEQVAKYIGGTPPTKADFDEAFKEWVSFSMLVNLSKE